MAKRETSSIYRWPEGVHALIDHIEIVRQKNGHSVAYIHANEDEAHKAQRQEARNSLRLKGWGTLSDHRDNRFVLRINGFTNDADLLNALEESGLTQGKPHVTTQAAEKEKPQGFIDSIRTNSLRAAGIFYSMGNAVYLASGILRSREKGKIDHGQIGSALMWGAGDALVATLGGKDDGRQLTSLLTKLKHHYEREGIDIPITAAIHSETSDKGKSLGDKAYDFAHEHLNQIKCATEVIAAFGYYKGGKDQGNIWKQTTAVTFGLGFFASLVIPEKKIDGEKYAAAGALGKFWMRVQSNPLSVGGISGYSNTLLTTYGAFDEGRRLRDPAHYPYKINKVTGATIIPSKYYKLDYAAPAVMLFGNSLYAMSKKTTGGDIRTDAMVRDVYSIASQVLNKLPENEQERALESTARFLAERPEVRGNHAEIRTRLKEAMDIQRKNPWFERFSVQPATTALATEPGKAPPTHQASTKIHAASLEHQAKGVASANDAHYALAANGRAV